MKGIIIYEDYRGRQVVEAIKLGMVNYECLSDTSDGSWINNLSGVRKESTQAYCNKEDTYDFETGALISLMKMCKFDKSYKAIEEAFKYNSYDAKKSNELEEENKNLKKRINELEIYNNQLEDRVAAEQRGGYKFLKDMEKLQEKFNKKVSDLRDQIHENSRLIQTNGEFKDKVKELEEKIATKNKDIDYLLEENKKYKKDIDELFESDKYWKSEAGRLSFEKHRLEEKVEKLKLDCEKLQHGYIDTDMIFCSGRQNGKQYKALVTLFKKLDQKKVDEAYKEAYGNKVIWCTSQPSIRDQLDSLIEGSKYAIPYTTEWIKPPTKREEMWNEIFEIHKKDDIIIKVKREDVNTFLHEIEKRFPEITWASGVNILEAKYTVKDIYDGLKTRDAVYFRLSKETKLSYTSDPDVYRYKDLKHIDYLPPLRWDLFKKGRIVVACTEEEVPEFREKAKRELGNIRIEKYSVENVHCNGPIRVYYHYDKDINWLKSLLVSGIPRIKVNNHKVYYWEDVR